MSAHRTHRPSIFQIGTVRDNGRTVVIAGWGLGLCAAQCSCHQDKITLQLSIAEDQANGLLGLISHRPCNCCGPWTATELASILRDFATLDGMIPTGAEPGQRNEDAA